jgi:hypothetical protein
MLNTTDLSSFQRTLSPACSHAVDYLLELWFRLLAGCWRIFSVLNMESTRSSEASVLAGPTWRRITEGGILHILSSFDFSLIYLQHYFI